MIIDYAEIVDVVKELIDGTGRQVTLQRLSTTAADASKPWKGAGTPTVAASVTLSATFVPASGEGFGKELVSEELLRKASQICLVAPDGTDLSAYNKILDGGTLYGVAWVHCLKPGDTVLLWAFGVNQ